MTSPYKYPVRWGSIVTYFCLATGVFLAGVAFEWQPIAINACLAILSAGVLYAIKLDRRLAIHEKTAVSQADFQELKTEVALLKQAVEELKQ